MNTCFQAYVNREKAKGKFDEKLFSEWISGKEIDQCFCYPNRDELSFDVKSCMKGSMFDLKSEANFPPYMDHAVLLSSSRRNKIWFVYQPYDLTDAAKREIIEWAIKSGLLITFGDTSKSWYYPGSTSLVVLQS